MDSRIAFSVVFYILSAVLMLCAVKGFTSPKKIGKAVALVDLSLIPPMIGNLIVINASFRLTAYIGYYIYFIGMDVMLFALVVFTNAYCSGTGDVSRKPTVMYYILAADALQMLLNPFFGHAFELDPIEVEDKIYYAFKVHFGQVIHRAACYTILGCVILMFILCTVQTVRIYRERLYVILASLLICAAWESYYIFTRTPIDRSMIGFGVFGILVFYFSIYYRPLRLLDRMLSTIAGNMPEALFVYDPNGKCIWANSRALELTGLTSRELDGVRQSLVKIFGEREYTTLDWSENRVIGSGSDTKYYSLENHFVSEDSESKHLVGSFLTIRDNTEEQRRLQRELYNSTHDSLTGLYTKQHLYECIRKQLIEDPDTEYSAVFIDVKNFKIVNDIFSTAFGDAALRQLADGIRLRMSDRCVYGRLAGDTFGVFLPSEVFKSQKEGIERALTAFKVSLGDVEHHLLIHLGVYEVTERDIDVSVMFDRAHLALSAINNNYKKHIAFYDKELRSKVLWEQQMTAGLSEAIQTGQIRPYLQPITDRDGKVVGAEALSRWIHPAHGFMSPAMFIPVFEKNGLIVEVDRHIWRCACEILSQWKGQHDGLFISVNISPKDFYFIDVVSEIRELVKEYGIDPAMLRIEITETVMMNEAEEKFKILRALRSEGFIVEMDDFGSGYSSLNLLKDMPVDVLKLDMKFLSDQQNDSKAQTIISNIIRLADELDITSLTEGVETAEQYQLLNRMGCKLFQGYYFAKPMPREEFESFAFGQNR